MAGVRDGLVDTLVQISELGSCLFPFFGAGLWDGPFWNRRSMIIDPTLPRQVESGIDDIFATSLSL